MNAVHLGADPSLYVVRCVLAIVCTSVGTLGAGCCDSHGHSCIDWVQQNETYSVELVQHLEEENDTDPDAPIPFDGYRRFDPCDEVDLDVGSRMRITAAGASTGDESMSCKCSYVKARAAIPNVKFLGDRDDTIPSGNWKFASVSDVRIGSHCDAVYAIGIARVSQDFINRSGQSVATDYILFRDISFQSNEPDCLDVPLGYRTCSDSWAVRVKNASGLVVTNELVVPNQSDSGTDDDAGR